MARKGKIFLFLTIIAVVFLIVFFIAKASRKDPEYVTEPAILGTLVQSVEGTGKIESSDRIDLSFKTSGRISSITKDAGDKVLSGEIIARLESRALESRVKDAEARLKEAEASYERLLAGVSFAELKVAEDTVSQRQKDLIAAEENVESIKQKNSVEIRNLKDTALKSLRSESIVAVAALSEISVILKDHYDNTDYVIKDKSLVQKTILSRDLAQSKLDELSDLYFSLSLESSDESILFALEKGIEVVLDTQESLKNAFLMVDSTVATWRITQTTLDSLKSSIRSQQSYVNSSVSLLQSAKANWTNKQAFFEDQISSANNAVSQARSALVVAESQLELKRELPRNFDIDREKARVMQAEASLSLSYSQLEEAIIRAPIAGTITKKHLQTGEQAQTGQPVLQMIGDSVLQIEIDISESDITKVSIGQEAEITIDSFGQDRKFEGILTFIDPVETLIQDVVYYKAKIAFVGDYNDSVKPGMSANATIITESKENTIYVPFRAVKSRNGMRYVEVLENSIVSERQVVLGLRGDEGIEILSGIKEGELVITFVR